MRLLTAFLIFTLPAAINLAAAQERTSITPSWFGTYQEPGLIIGFGEATSRDDAILQARKEIAESLEASITTESSTNVHKEENGSSQSYSSRAISFSRITLSDTTVVKEINNGSEWFVAVSYDASPLPKRISRRVSPQACTKQATSRYMEATPLSDEVAHEVGCPIPLKLTRIRGTWAVETGENVFPLRPDDEFSKLMYTSVGSQEVLLHLDPPKVSNGSPFKLIFSTQSHGYVSLYNVYGDGIVAELRANIPSTAGREVSFPSDTGNHQQLVAALIDPRAAAEELYVAVFSTEPITLNSFSLATSSIQTSSSSAQMDILLRLLEKWPFSSATLHISPR